MKTKKNLAKIVSKGTALVLCFATLLFALLMLWGIATPAHVYADPFPICNPPCTTATPIGTVFSIFPTPTAIFTVTPIVTATTPATVDVDNSSYAVGDSMTVTLGGFPANTTVSLTVQTTDGSNSHDLNSVTTDPTGSSTSVHSAPSSPTGTVEIVANGGSVTATSSTFTINKKAAAPAPAPAPAAAPPAPAPVNYPPAALAATPTPVPTAKPTAVPTDTPTPVPSPTVAPTPTAVPVVTHTTNTSFLGGRLPLVLAIGLGALIALGILFFVGRVLLRRYLSPAPLPDVSPSAVPPWMRAQDDSIPANTMINGIPFAQTMPFNSSFPPGNGGVAPGPGNDPQQVPFNGPFGPSNGGFTPGPGNGPQPQPVPFNSPFGPSNGGFTPGPGNGPQPQPVPFGGPYQPGNSGFAPANVPQEPFPPNDRFPPPN